MADIGLGIEDGIWLRKNQGGWCSTRPGRLGELAEQDGGALNLQVNGTYKIHFVYLLKHLLSTYYGIATRDSKNNQKIQGTKQEMVDL